MLKDKFIYCKLTKPYYLLTIIIFVMGISMDYLKHFLKLLSISIKTLTNVFNKTKIYKNVIPFMFIINCDL